MYRAYLAVGLALTALYFAFPAGGTGADGHLHAARRVGGDRPPVGAAGAMAAARPRHRLLHGRRRAVVLLRDAPHGRVLPRRLPAADGRPALAPVPERAPHPAGGARGRRHRPLRVRDLPVAVRAVG